jgi:ABC-type Fe3+/spermidine/putrescine transport system ATPase subunit
VRGAAVSLVVRPERVTLEPAETDVAALAGGVNRLPGHIRQTTFRGAQTQVTVVLPGFTLLADVANVHGEVPDWLGESREVWACVAPDAIRVLPRPSDGELATRAPSGG